MLGNRDVASLYSSDLRQIDWFRRDFWLICSFYFNMRSKVGVLQTFCTRPTDISLINRSNINISRYHAITPGENMENPTEAAAFHEFITKNRV